MSKQALMIVIGDSLLVDGVGISMQKNQGITVIRMDNFCLDIVERVKTLDPDVIVFELWTPWPFVILSLLKEQPGTVFLGLDLDHSEVTVLNSSRYAMDEMSDLYKLAQAELGYEVPEWKGGKEIEKMRNFRYTR